MAQLVSLVERLPLPTRPFNLRIGSEIDRGAWGAVHEGCLDRQLVAVKRIHQLLREAHGGVNVFRSFCGECERLKALDHPHVISECVHVVATLWQCSRVNNDSFCLAIHSQLSLLWQYRPSVIKFCNIRTMGFLLIVFNF